MGMFGAELVNGLAGRHEKAPSIQERYTDATRMALLYARDECQSRGETAITVADLLAGLSFEEDTRAERIGSLKVNGFYLRWLVGLPALPAATDASLADSRLTLDEDAQQALAFAVVEADRDREYWIDSDHLLRGLLRFPNKANFAVLKTEMNLDRLRIASRKDREQFLPEETPNLKVMQYLMRKHAALWLPPVVGLAGYLYILIQGVHIGIPLAGK